MSAVRKAKTIDERAAAMFATEVAKLEMTILVDQGLYRHLVFQRPDTRLYWFEFVTWPGTLAVRGDLDGFMFTRMEDMFEFFRGSSWNGQPNLSYWAEKADDPERCQAYSEEVFRSEVLRDVHERRDERPPGLFKALDEELFSSWWVSLAAEEDARKALERFEHQGFEFCDTWEWNFHDYTWHFRRACHAIVWGIGQYDAVRSKQQDGGRGRMSAVLCPTEGHGRSTLAIATVTFPDGRFNPTKACAGCANVMISDALAEGRPVLIEPILAAYGGCPSCRQSVRLRPSGLIAAHTFKWSQCDGRGREPLGGGESRG